MTVSTTCSCGCSHSVNSDSKELLTSSRKCFVCGEVVSFKLKEKPVEAAESPTPTSAVAAESKRRGRPKTKDQPVKRRGRPRKQ